MTEVGRISVKVTPDTDDFRAQLRRQLERIERELAGEVPVGGDFNRLRSQASAAVNALPDAEIDARLNTRGIRAQARSVLQGVDASLDIDANFRRSALDQIEATLSRLLSAADRALFQDAAKGLKARINAEVAPGQRSQWRADIQSELSAIRNLTFDLEPRLDSSFGDRLLARSALSRFPVTPRLDLAATAAIKARIEALDPRITPQLDARRIVVDRKFFGLGKIKVPVEVDEEGFDRSVSRLRRKLPDLKSLIPNFGTGLNPAGYAVVFAGILAVAAPLVGLITSALLTLPGLISAVAVPIAAITLGLDGFKKAAESIKEPFDALRASISAKVESQFTPIFEELAKGFPILERAMPRVTQGLADIASSVTNFLTQGTGANQLEQLIGGIGDRLTQVAPGVRDFTAALLGLANQFVNGGALEGVGAWFNDTMADFKNWVAEMSASGDLDAAFRGLGESLKVVADALGKIALEGLDFITDPGKVRGFTDALAGLGEVLRDIVGISESLAPAFKLLDLALKIPSVAGVLVDMGNRGRDIGAALGDGVEAGVDAGFKLGADMIVPPDIGAAVSEQIKNQITVSAEDQKQALRSAFTAGGVDTAVSQQLTQQIQAAIQGARDAMTQFGPELQAAVDNSLLSLATIGDKVGAAFTGIGPAVAMGFTPAVEAAASGVSQIIQTISSGFGNLYNTVVGALAGMASAVSAGMATGAQAAATSVANILEVISAGLSALPAVVSAWFSAVPPAIQSAMAPAITTVADICQQMVSTALSFAGAMESAGYSIGASFAAGLGKSGGLVSDAAGNLMGLARAFFPNSPAKTGPFSGAGWVDKSGEAIGMSFADGITNSTSTVLSTAKELMQAIKDVFGDVSGLVFNFNFGGDSNVGMGGLTTQMSNATSAAKGFQSALTDSVNPTRQLDASAKAQVTELSRQLALLEQRRKELELMRFGDQDNTGIKAELDLIRQQKLALGLEKDRLTYAQKYEGTVTSTNDKYDQQLQQLASMPLDFAKTTANSFMSDFGISGQGALPALANWGIEAGSKYIFNVNGVDEAKALWQNQVNVESMGVVGR